MTLRQLYVAEDGRHLFRFAFVQRSGHIDIYCTAHPGFEGRDTTVSKSHLYSDGEVCIVEGREPRSIPQARSLAKAWAEFFLRYRESGITEG